MPIHGYAGGVISATPVVPTSTSASGVWTTELQAQALAAGNWPNASSQIARSLRFNSADSASLTRTPASAGNRKTWTWSGWIKRSQLTSTYYVLVNPNGNSDATWTAIYFSNTDTFAVESWNTIFFNSTGVYRDPSAWYHFVVSADTTQATASERLKVYVNGQAATGTYNYPTQNFEFSINAALLARFGLLGGYLAETYFIDGQALTPSSFGYTDPNTGVWVPNAYTGSYGTNGFHLNFYNNTGTTSTTLGLDTSGNGNNWTPNNFSVTAGAGNDSLVDSPTPYGTDTGAGGEVRGNYATLNPLNKNTSGTLSNGNLEWQASTSAVQVVTGTSAIIPSGKTYFELNVVTAAGAGTYYQVGIAPPGKSLTTDIGNSSGNGYSIEQNQNQDIQLRLNGTSVTVSTVVQTGDVLQVAVDHSTGKLWFGRNNTWYNSSGGTTGNPGAGTNETATISTTADWFPAVAKYSTGGSYAINFGQRPFAYTAPSGFKALCTTNLPTPTIGATSTTRADDYFNTVLYTGNGTSQSLDAGLQADLLWLSPRSNTGGIRSYDILNFGGPYTPGVSSGSYLRTTTTDALLSGTTNGVTALTSTGFDVSGTGSTTNQSSATYVGWAWKANGAGSSNTQGTITSTVSANTTAGFSIVTYTGNATSGATVGHGLGAVPQMIILKIRSTTGDWPVYHVSTGNTKALYLNLTNGQGGDFTGAWNNTTPTSTLFTLGNSVETNANSGTFVAYCFAAVPGYSAFGSYTGNGSADGPFVYTGFRPAYLLIKRSNDAADWYVYDVKRNTYNALNSILSPNQSVAEATNAAYAIDFTSNGFKLRNTATYDNSNGSTYIYAAFAEFPFKYTLAR